MKNCPKCGTQLPDDAVFCNNCGANLAYADVNTSSEANKAAPEELVNNEILNEAREKTKNHRIGLAVVGIAGVLIVIVLIGIFSALFSGGNYKTPVKKLMNALNSGSHVVEDYADACFPEFAYDTYADLYDLSKDINPDLASLIDESTNEVFDSIFDSYKETYGDDYKITYELKKAEKLDKLALASINQSWEDTYDRLCELNLDNKDYYQSYADLIAVFSGIEIPEKSVKKFANIGTSAMDELEKVHVSKGYRVKLKFNIKGSVSEETKTYEFNVVKMNNTWVIDLTSDNELFENEKFIDSDNLLR